MGRLGEIRTYFDAAGSWFIKIGHSHLIRRLDKQRTGRSRMRPFAKLRINLQPLSNQGVAAGFKIEKLTIY